MANVVKISLGSLGCLGGEGNLRNASLHDSTCQCEGCVEKRLADREFSIRTDKVFGAKDYGFNDGDEENLFNEAGEVIVLSDGDDLESVSDISPNDDGYCDDGEDNEDTYSVFSPKPCTINEQDELGTDDDMEEEDTPPVSVEDTINDASIEASKKDGQMVEECFSTIEDEGQESVQLRHLHTTLDEERYKAAKFWKTN